MKKTQRKTITQILPNSSFTSPWHFQEGFIGVIDEICSTAKTKTKGKKGKGCGCGQFPAKKHKTKKKSVLFCVVEEKIG